MTGDLPWWTVYERPRDFPHCWVAREFLIRSGETVATDNMIIGPTLDMVRSALPPGLVCIPRSPEDEPHIVESWI